jgi:hypothetical protein
MPAIHASHSTPCCLPAVLCVEQAIPLNAIYQAIFSGKNSANKSSLWLAKIESGSTYVAACLIQPMYAPYAETVHGPDRLQFVFPPGTTDGNSGFATTALCFEGTTLPAKTHCSGQSLLGDASSVLVGVETRACHRPTGDSRRLASSRFQAVLDMALAA